MISSFRETASIVAPWFSSTSASRSFTMISCGVCRFLFIESSCPRGLSDSHISWYSFRGSGHRKELTETVIGLNGSNTKFERREMQPHELNSPYLRQRIADAEKLINEFRKKHPKLPNYL